MKKNHLWLAMGLALSAQALAQPGGYDRRGGGRGHDRGPSGIEGIYRSDRGSTLRVRFAGTGRRGQPLYRYQSDYGVCGNGSGLITFRHGQLVVRSDQAGRIQGFFRGYGQKMTWFNVPVCGRSFTIEWNKITRPGPRPRPPRGDHGRHDDWDRRDRDDRGGHDRDRDRRGDDWDRDPRRDDHRDRDRGDRGRRG